ncbi:PIG-L family deacetylase [Aquipuribacter hungaricus]|uniref:PIG-L family deacetylase n=1 Tax=Aquipuribacter hungaricus TaxID=545624 RepID=A0ABV7WCJ4_9MICO
MTLRLLLVHAHPDDETLTHGATVAAALAHGHEVDLVTCTRGEEGEVIGDAEQHRTSHRDDTLAELREAELAAALDALAAGTGGRVAHTYLDGLPAAAGTRRQADRYRDSGMVVLPGGRAAVPPDVRPDCFAVADLDEAAARLAGLVRRRRPHVVLTYGPHGGYGHPDHVMAHRVTLRALDLAADTATDTDGAADAAPAKAAAWTVPWVYGAAADADALRSWLRHRADPAAWDPDGPLPHLFVPPADIDATVRAGAWLASKAAALRALPSQATVLDDAPGSAALALSNDVPQPLTGDEAGQLLRPVAPAAEPLALAVDDPLRALLLPAGTRPAAPPHG